MHKGSDIRAATAGGLWVAGFVLLVLIYLPALYDLVLDWSTDSNYSHGFLVPLVSLWLLWQKRQELKGVPLATDGRGMIVVALGLALFVLGNGAAEYFTLRLSFVVTLFGLVFFFFGGQLVRKVWFELAFLLFMIPIPYVVYYAATLPMQLLASKITAAVLNLIGMGVVRQGNILHISGYSLEVADACSGIRSLISLLALGVLYAYLTQRRSAGKIFLFLCTIPIAVAANVFRVLITSLLACTVTEEVSAEPFHTILGLSVFLAAFVMFFIVGAIARRVWP